MPLFCLLCFSGLCDQIVNLFASEHFPKERIVLVLLPQSGVFLFEPVVACYQMFVFPIQLSVSLIDPMVVIPSLCALDDETFYHLFKLFDQWIGKLGLITLGRHKRLRLWKLILRIVFQFISELVCAWAAIAKKYHAGEISRDEYDKWRYYYPQYDDTQITAKVPSQELNDAMVKALKSRLNKD